MEHRRTGSFERPQLVIVLSAVVIRNGSARVSFFIIFCSVDL